MPVNSMDPRIRIWRSKRSDRERVIEGLDLDVADALERARQAPFPSKVRPAVSADIVVGAVIWYKGELDGGPWWKLVLEVHRPADLWKGFDSEDGDRCGLDDAFVEVEDE